MTPRSGSVRRTAQQCFRSSSIRRSSQDWRPLFPTHCCPPTLATLRLVPRQNDLPRRWCASEYTIWLLVSRRGRKRCPMLFCPRPTNNDSALPLITQLPRTLMFSAAAYLIARARAIGDVSSDQTSHALFLHIFGTLSSPMFCYTGKTPSGPRHRYPHMAYGLVSCFVTFHLPPRPYLLYLVPLRPMVDVSTTLVCSSFPSGKFLC